MKNIGFLVLLVLAVLLFTVAFPAAAGPKASVAPTPVVAAVPAAAVAVAMPEKHPHIDEALEHMRAAKHELEIAAHDFKGHRVKSLGHLNEAIEEAEICLKVDAD